MQRFFLAAFICIVAAPVSAQSEKETSCQFQAAVVDSVRAARLDDVAQEKVQSRVTDNAPWPDKFNAIVPIVTPWIYGLTAAEVRDNDLGEVWKTSCLAQ